MVIVSHLAHAVSKTINCERKSSREDTVTFVYCWTSRTTQWCSVMMEGSAPRASTILRMRENKRVFARGSLLEFQNSSRVFTAALRSKSGAGGNKKARYPHQTWQIHSVFLDQTYLDHKGRRLQRPGR